MAFDLDELERIGTSALCNHRIPCDLSTEQAVNRFIAAAGLNWQAMIEEIRRLRADNKQLREENNHFRRERDRVWYDG